MSYKEFMNSLQEDSIEIARNKKALKLAKSGKIPKDYKIQDMGFFGADGKYVGKFRNETDVIVNSWLDFWNNKE